MDGGDDDKGDKGIIIFFDFECTQDSQLECDKGFLPDEETGTCTNCKKKKCGSFVHKPILCVAQRVCLVCWIKM